MSRPMSRKFYQRLLPAVVVALLAGGAGCAMMKHGMMRMMGMGDMVTAMGNMNSLMTEEDPRTGQIRQKAGGNVMKMMQKMKPMAMKMKQEAIARGHTYYNDPEFSGGHKGQSCNSCHPGGASSGQIVETPMPLNDGNPARLPVPSLKGVAASFPKFKVPNAAVVTLGTMSNNCIRMFMGGKRLDHNDQRLRDLVAYLGTLKKDGQ